MLELAAHRDQRLRGRRDVLTRSAPPPGIGARASVGEDAPREHDPVLTLGPQLREHAERVVVGAVELGLDVRLVAGGPDQRGVALGAEEQADRVREDRLARTRLARDRVQPRPELELRLADQDEVRDAERAEHRSMVRRGVVGVSCPYRTS